LVPRRLVRVLPWINYDDFFRTEFSAYLAARRSAVRNIRIDSEDGGSSGPGEGGIGETGGSTGWTGGGVVWPGFCAIGFSGAGAGALGEQPASRLSSSAAQARDGRTEVRPTRRSPSVELMANLRQLNCPKHVGNGLHVHSTANLT